MASPNVSPQGPTLEVDSFDVSIDLHGLSTRNNDDGLEGAPAVPPCAPAPPDVHHHQHPLLPGQQNQLTGFHTMDPPPIAANVSVGGSPAVERRNSSSGEHSIISVQSGSSCCSSDGGGGLPHTASSSTSGGCGATHPQADEEESSSEAQKVPRVPSIPSMSAGDADDLAVIEDCDNLSHLSEGSLDFVASLSTSRAGSPAQPSSPIMSPRRLYYRERSDLNMVEQRQLVQLERDERMMQLEQERQEQLRKQQGEHFYRHASHQLVEAAYLYQQSTPALTHLRPQRSRQWFSEVHNDVDIIFSAGEAMQQQQQMQQQANSPDGRTPTPLPGSPTGVVAAAKHVRQELVSADLFPSTASPTKPPPQTS